MLLGTYQDIERIHWWFLFDQKSNGPPRDNGRDLETEEALKWSLRTKGRGVNNWFKGLLSCSWGLTEPVPVVF